MFNKLLYRILPSILSLQVFFLLLNGNPTLARDPFRNTKPRLTGENTEIAFEQMFEEGNYLKAKEYLMNIQDNEAEASEPLAHALRASLAYTENDWENLNIYALKTISVAKKLKANDPLRGNLYLAVGNFLEGAYIFEKSGAIPALNKLQKVFKYFDRAKKIDSSDPELNLIRGYMDLFLAVNLPFFNPEKTIDNFQKYAAPNYLVYRGIALAYRDLDRYNKALEFTDKALKITPNNPELHYLKGQIIRIQGRENNNLSLLEEALFYFDLALEKAEILPETTLKPLKRERDKTAQQIEELKLGITQNN